MSDTLILDAPREWRRTTLATACADGGGIQTGPFGSQLHASDYVPEGIPCVMPQDLGDNVIREDEIAYITPENAQRLSKYLLRRGDIVYSRRGDVTRRALVQPGQDGWLCGTGCLRVRPGVEVDAPFLSYYLGHPEARDWITRHAVGATMANLNTQILGAVPIVLPDMDEQRAIAAVLGALDDKIAVNDRILVAADKLMRVFYEISCNRASETITIGELGRLVRDGVPVSSLTGGEHYIGLEHVPRRNMWLTTWEDNAELASGKSAFRSKDVLFGKLRPYFHKVGLALTPGVCSTDILVIRPIEPARLGWLLLVLSSDEVVAHASAVGDGTRMPRTKWKDLESHTVPWPGDAEATQLNATVRSLAARVQASAMESRTLAALRDTLLPQLMSGRLRVKDAEKIVEANT